MLNEPKYLFFDGPAPDYVLNQLDNSGVIGLDIEASGLDPYTGNILLIQVSPISIDPNIVYIFAARNFDTRVRDILHARDDMTFLIHNAVYEYKWLKHKYDWEIKQPWDTMIAEALITMGLRKEVGLAKVASRRLNIKMDKRVRRSFIGRAPDTQFSDKELQYAARDVLVLKELYTQQIEELKRRRLINVMKLESRTVAVTAEMELNGVALDVDRWSELAREYEIELLRVLKELYSIVPEPHAIQLWFFDEIQTEIAKYTEALNIGSPEQALKYANRLGFDIEDTQALTIKALRGKHPYFKLLLDFRKYSKALQSFLYPYPDLINPVTGRIHPNFRQIATFDRGSTDGATTGRYSCQNPNLQQVLSENTFRHCFKARKNKKIITADYSGCEVIAACNISRDAALIAFYNEGGGDLHGYVASLMFHLPVELTSKSHDENGNEIEPEYKKERTIAKTVTFGTFYGQGAYGLMIRINTYLPDDEQISLEEAQKFIDDFKNAFPRLAETLRQLGEDAFNYLESRTPLGRVKYYHRIVEPRKEEFEDVLEYQEAYSEYRKKRFRIERQGRNHPIQGGNADIIKAALVDLRTQMPEDFTILMTVHDEIVAEVPEEKAEDYNNLMVQIMEEAANRTVPGPVKFAVSSKIERSWVK